MKKVTEWNNVPREMIVWDSGCEKRILKVIYIFKTDDPKALPVITANDEDCTIKRFGNAAEIDEN